MSIKVLFSDVGGVILTNGWDRELRKKMASLYNLDFEKLQVKHEEVFDLFERGKIDFDTYLDAVIFYERRAFSKEEFKKTIFETASPFQEMMDLLKSIREEGKIKLVALSNEGRDLAIDRIQRFKLDELFDFFIFSSFVHLRKPDRAIYQLALDLLQVEPNSALYIDDRLNMVEMARTLGMQAIHHENFEKTKSALISLSVQVSQV